MDYITVHTLDGRHVHVNRQAIVTIGGARTDEGQPMLTGKAKCMVTLVDGKFITVVESCDALQRRLQQHKQVPP
jgi:hypothetical protein